MSSGPSTVRPNLPLSKLEQRLERQKLTTALVTTNDGRLVGVVTRKTLVREVVAGGRDPNSTTLGEIAEEPNATLDSGMGLHEAFALLEEQDYERVPVLEDGKLVGVLSRSVVQRRLAEDDPPAEQDD